MSKISKRSPDAKSSILTKEEPMEDERLKWHRMPFCNGAAMIKPGMWAIQRTRQDLRKAFPLVAMAVEAEKGEGRLLVGHLLSVRCRL